MPAPVPLRWLRNPIFLDYGAAILSVAVSLFVSILLHQEFDFEPLAPFLCAMMFSGWFGGFKPGLLSVALSLLAFHHFFLVPIYPSGVLTEVPRLIVVALTSLFILALSVTQRNTSAALGESRRTYLSLFENMAESVGYLQMLFEDGQLTDATVLAVNPAWEKLTGIKGVVGRRLSDVFAGSGVTPEFLRRTGAVAMNGQPDRFELFSTALNMWIFVSAYSPKKEQVIVVFYNITERKQAEEALQRSEEQLQALVGRLNTVREDEAKRIARQLHDDLGQELTALNMELSDLETKLADSTPSQRAQIAQMHRTVDKTIDAVQALSYELRLGQLDLLGLAAAIDWQLKEFSLKTGTRVEITRLDEISSLSDSKCTAVFRILQEALTNIVRHAGASRVLVSLEAGKDKVTLEIRDNGRGIAAAELNDRRALGLLGMRERAISVGGNLTISGAPGTGTAVLVTVPMEPAVEHVA
jgi:signal transduction histidine kinase